MQEPAKDTGSPNHEERPTATSDAQSRSRAWQRLFRWVVHRQQARQVSQATEQVAAGQHGAALQTLAGNRPGPDSPAEKPQEPPQVERVVRHTRRDAFDSQAIIEDLATNKETVYVIEEPGMPPIFVMRDHDATYNSWLWMEQHDGQSLHGMAVIHIDAHADLPYRHPVTQHPVPRSETEALQDQATYSTFLINAAASGHVG